MNTPLFTTFIIIVLLSNIDPAASNSNQCSGPLLSQSLNLWAPLDRLLKPEIVSGLNICKNLEGKSSCCSANTINDYKRKWATYKEYFESENSQQVDLHNSRVIFAYQNKDLYKSIVKEMKSLISAADDVYRSLKNTINNGEANELKKDIPDEMFIDVSKLKLPAWLKTVESSIRENAQTLNSTYESVVRYLKQQDLVSSLEFLRNNELLDSVNFDQFMAPLDENEIEMEVFKAQERIRKFVAERERCLSATMRHFASVFCVICDEDNHGFHRVGNKLMLNLSTQTCGSLLSDCYEYLQTEIDLNNNMLFTANIESYERVYKEMNKNFDPTDISAITEFLDLRSKTMRDSMKAMIFYKLPENCSDARNCGYVCQEFINVLGVNVSEVLNGTVVDWVDNNLMNEGMDMVLNFMNNNGNTRRFLDSTAVNLSNYQTLESSLKYSEEFTFDSYKFAETTGADFSVSGTGKIQVFNLSGKLSPEEAKAFFKSDLNTSSSGLFLLSIYSILCMFIMLVILV